MTYIQSPREADHVFQSDEDGQWHFWDESGAYSHGPYECETLARENLARYVEQLDAKK